MKSRSLPEEFRRKSAPGIDRMSEVDLVRHFTLLSRKNFGVDNGFYPLGSCTMKYNPKINEDMAALEGFTQLHPLESEGSVQGMLRLLHELESYLCSIFGFDAFCLSPLAGAHGELTALFVAKAYFESLGQTQRKKVIIPDSAHGTNPASCSIAGLEVVSVRSDADGGIDLADLEKLLDDNVAVLMLTNPNTLGLFDRNICNIAELLHFKGALFYMDGANANALLGKVRPSDLGFDMCHINLHKTFSTPHGGGGPGAGPIGVTKKLEPFLPGSRIVKQGDRFRMCPPGKRSIGSVSTFYGNVAVMIKAYSYIRGLGAKGLRQVSENAVLNANYIKERLKQHYYLPYERTCQHEFVISAKWQKEKYGVRALDIAKRLLDFGFHPPTIYFPLIVEEAMMIEPTETESKKTLDSFIDAMIKIAQECKDDPELVKTAPHTTLIGRLNEVKAAKDLDLCQK